MGAKVIILAKFLIPNLLRACAIVQWGVGWVQKSKKFLRWQISLVVNDNIKSSCRSKRKLMPHIESNYTLSCIELCELCIAAWIAWSVWVALGSSSVREYSEYWGPPLSWEPFLWVIDHCTTVIFNQDHNICFGFLSIFLFVHCTTPISFELRGVEAFSLLCLAHNPGKMSISLMSYLN